MRHFLLGTLVFTVLGCNRSEPPPAAPAVVLKSGANPVSKPPPAPAPKSALSRQDFNRIAQRLDLPLYWAQDTNGNGAVDPDEVRSLLFYGRTRRWVAGGKFTPAFEEAYAAMVRAAKESFTGSPEEVARRALVARDLDAAALTLVDNDLRVLSPADKAFVRHVLDVSRRIDNLHGRMTGMASLIRRVPANDKASQRLLRRNWGAKCAAPQVEKNPQCSALPGAPLPIFDIYPASLQRDPKFCESLEKRPDAKELMKPFVVVREQGGKLEPVPYTQAYAAEMGAIAGALRATAESITDPSEAALKAYLQAAAQAFTDNNWEQADEKWAQMNAHNSKWYLRVGPDETYWEPCSQKAGFHVTFARINRDSLKWQQKLTPVQQEMEAALAALIGKPYQARKVSFHLPDFIDIIVNAGEDRRAFGATIGQSLPNWGKVVSEGRGRTVAMSNLYLDSDSIRYRRARAEALLDKESMAALTDNPTAGLLTTILHEATHNLGPAHEYKYQGKADREAFGGGLAQMLEELKAQSGALFFIDWLLRKGLISRELARDAYADSAIWIFGQISRGMYDSQGKRRPYSQLAAIQLGYLLDDGAVNFDANALATNGKDRGVLTFHYDKLPAAAEKLMKKVGAIKATADRPAAEALAARYVDGTVVPLKLISERVLRSPRASFVFSLSL
jgi:hypothetical protein